MNIFFKHTARTVRFLVTYETLQNGVVINQDDPNIQFIEHVIHCIKLVIKQNQDIDTSNRPDFAKIVDYLTQDRPTETDSLAGQLCSGMIKIMSHGVFSKMSHIASDSDVPEHIMFV